MVRLPVAPRQLAGMADPRKRPPVRKQRCRETPSGEVRQDAALSRREWNTPLSEGEKMHSRLWSMHRRQDGTAALETALVFPAVTLILFLMIDLGVFFFDYVSAGNAVREAVRCGALGHGDAVVETRLEDTSGFSEPTGVTIDRTGGQIGGDIVVAATFTHDWILPATVLGVPDTYTVDATARIEGTNAIGGCGP